MYTLDYFYYRNHKIVKMSLGELFTKTFLFSFTFFPFIEHANQGVREKNLFLILIGGIAQ